ncbi:hypothetical protein BRC71_06970 [Halobacteriales archaeon QH_7_65_31]|nr:MAG: hypothetical protein BRC71_06970 [Halobacteriales archaeon QH_7_65_31]
MSDHVETHAHELQGNLLYTQHNDAPYWAMRSLYNAFDGGSYSTFVEVDGEEWKIELSYQRSGVAPRPSDDVRRLYEYRLKADGANRRTISGRMQPRFETMHKFDNDAVETVTDELGNPVKIQSVPSDLGAGVNWRFDGVANIEPTDLPRLLSLIMTATADSLGHQWDSQFFRGRPHRYSCVTDYERYVRLRRDCTSQLIDPTGAFSRIRELLADQQGTKMDISIDNTGKNKQIEGYNHQYRLNEYCANQLLPGGQNGKQLKHYHPEYVHEDATDPLYHPKFGVLFKKAWNNGRSIPWRDLDELTHELEETIMNVLSWSGLPVKAGSPTFVSDDCFDADARSDLDIGWYDDPTPDIESSQESLFVRKITELTGGEEDVLRQLTTDGGSAEYDDLADDAGVSISTLYRALDRVDELVDSDNGTVSFISEHAHKMFRRVLKRAERTISTAAKAAGRVLDMDPRRIEEQGSAFQAWLNEYAVDVVESSSDQVKIKIGAMLSRFKSTAEPTLEDVIHYGRICWNRSGRGDVLDWHFVTVTAEIDGSVETFNAGSVLPD